MADKMTTSSDKPVPQGMTEAQFTEQQRKDAAQQAVTREQAAQHTATPQRSAADRLRDPQSPQEQATQPAETLAQGSQTERSRLEHQQYPSRQKVERDDPMMGSSSFGMTSTPLVTMKEHFEAVLVVAKELPNSQELADFITAVFICQRLLRDLSVKETE